jgi:hypothetical protein
MWNASAGGALACVCALSALTLGAGPASARISVSEFSVTPSTLQAGATPRVTIVNAFDYGGEDDDVKDVTVRLPAGLVGNPLVPVRCTSQQFAADACPAGSQVGTTAVETLVSLVPTTAAGSVYNLRPTGSEPVRLGIVVRPPVGDKQFLQARVHLRPGEGGYGLETTFADMPRTVTLAGVPVPITITRITLTFDATVNGRAFMRNPTSCATARATARAASYAAPSELSPAATTSISPTGCERLAFAPRLEGSLGGARGTSKGRHPSVATTLRFGEGHAALRSATVTLPPFIGSNVQALSRVCPPSAFEAGACPGSARVGSATASSPLSPEPLSGPVLLVQSPGRVEPKLAVRLDGPVSVSLIGTTRLTTKGIETTFEGSPDLPLASFTLAFDGGAGGLLTNGRDLCAPRIRASTAGLLTAHTGRTAPVTADLKIEGCGPQTRAKGKPRVRGSLRFRNGLATLGLRVAAPRSAAPLRTVRLRLPRGLRPTRTGAARLLLPRVRSDGRRLSRRSFRLGGPRLTVPLRGGARSLQLSWRSLGPSRGLARALKARARLRFTIRVTDASGASHAVRLRLRARV